MRLQALTNAEIYRFHRELLRRLPDNVDQTILTESDVETIARSNSSLSNYVDRLTDCNDDLAKNLFRATVIFIDQQDYGGFEDHPTFSERPDDFKKPPKT